MLCFLRSFVFMQERLFGGLDRIPVHLRTKSADEVDILDLSSSVASSSKRKKIVALEPFLYLRTLDLSGNYILRIEGLKLLKNLSRLNLARNHIKIIDGLETLIQLEELDLSGNYITHIPKKISMNAALQKLDLSGNNLSVLREVEHLKRISNLRNLCLGTNPLAKLPHFKHYVIFHLRTLSVLDFAQVNAQDRTAACERFDTTGERASESMSSPTDLKATQKNSQVVTQQNSTLQEENMRLRNELTVQQQLLNNKSSQYSQASEQLSHLEQELAMRRIDESSSMVGRSPPSHPPSTAEVQRESLVQSVQSAGGHGFDRQFQGQYPQSSATIVAPTTPGHGGAVPMDAPADRAPAHATAYAPTATPTTAYAPTATPTTAYAPTETLDETVDIASAPMIIALQSSVTELQRQQQAMLQKKAMLTRHCSTMRANLADAKRSLDISSDEMGKVGAPAR
jgi:hypothetical protein